MAAENEWFFAPVDVYGPLGSVVTVTAFNTLPEAAANTWVSYHLKIHQKL